MIPTQANIVNNSGPSTQEQAAMQVQQMQVRKLRTTEDYHNVEFPYMPQYPPQNFTYQISQEHH